MKPGFWVRKVPPKPEPNIPKPSSRCGVSPRPESTLNPKRFRVYIGFRDVSPPTYPSRQKLECQTRELLMKGSIRGFSEQLRVGNSSGLGFRVTGVSS